MLFVLSSVDDYGLPGRWALISVLCEVELVSPSQIMILFHNRINLLHNFVCPNFCFSHFGHMLLHSLTLAYDFGNVPFEHCSLYVCFYCIMNINVAFFVLRKKTSLDLCELYDLQAFVASLCILFQRCTCIATSRCTISYFSCITYIIRTSHLPSPRKTFIFY